jgi:pilus assembly protein CpaB
VAIDDIISATPKSPRPGGSRRSASRAIVFWTLALMAGASSAVMLKVYLDKRQASAPTLTPVVVAALDLPLATTLKLEHLSVVEWPQNARPAGTFVETKDLVGRVLISKTLQGEPILAPRLAAREAGSGLAALIPNNMRAAAVRVDDVVGVAGFIHPEDRVDVIVTLKTQNSEPASKVILQNVKVLAVGQQLEIEEKSRGKALPVTVATLLVTPEQSEKLALAATQGKLLLTLRSWTDDSQVATAGVNPAALLEGSGRSAAPVVAADSSRSRSDERRRSSRREEKVAAVPSAPASQHVEILRGDRFEERKFEAKEKP